MSEDTKSPEPTRGARVVHIDHVPWTVYMFLLVLCVTMCHIDDKLGRIADVVEAMPTTCKSKSP